jgi:hypothetical protein
LINRALAIVLCGALCWPTTGATAQGVVPHPAINSEAPSALQVLESGAGGAWLWGPCGATAQRGRIVRTYPDGDKLVCTYLVAGECWAVRHRAQVVKRECVWLPVAGM